MLAGVAQPSGGSILQMHDGTLEGVMGNPSMELNWHRSSAGFPEPCPDMRATPAGVHFRGDALPASVAIIQFSVMGGRAEYGDMLHVDDHASTSTAAICCLEEAAVLAP